MFASASNCCLVSIISPSIHFYIIHDFEIEFGLGLRHLSMKSLINTGMNVSRKLLLNFTYLCFSYWLLILSQ